MSIELDRVVAYESSLIKRRIQPEQEKRHDKAADTIPTLKPTINKIAATRRPAAEQKVVAKDQLVNIKAADDKIALAKNIEAPGPAETTIVLEATKIKSVDGNLDPTHPIAVDDEPFQIPEVTSETAIAHDPNEPETYQDERLELCFGPEVIATYQELLLLDAGTEDESVEFLAGQLEASDDTDLVTNEPYAVISTDIMLEQNFELFIDQQPESEEPVTLAIIHERSNQQPLEQTFMQLCEVLSSDVEPAQYTQLQEIIQEIKLALPACYIASETEEPKLQITPDMTERLLTLISLLGHEDPREALVNFVSRYDMAFLVQALQYMCDLSHENARQKFLSNPIPINTNNNGVVSLRIVKVLFGLISRLGLNPVP